VATSHVGGGGVPGSKNRDERNGSGKAHTGTPP